MQDLVGTVRNFFEVNTDLVYFVYGQVFFVLGLAIMLQSRRHSRLELARSLSWLAAFGITHGLHEWASLFIPIQATYMNATAVSVLQILQVVLLAVSFGALFQFGVELLRDRWPWLAMLPSLVVVGWGMWFLVLELATNRGIGNWQQEASIWARYLIGFPGGILSAYGLRYQAERQIKPLNLGHIYRTLRITGLSLGAYAIWGGLVVSAGDFFPASWLNNSHLVLWLGVPAPVFRSVAGLVMAITIIRALEVFDVEVDRLIEQMQIERSLAAERERIGRELHDGAIQQAYTAGLIIESARNKVSGDSIVGQRLERAMTALNEAIDTLRTYMNDLRPGPPNVSLAEGLRRQAADPRLTTLMDVDLKLDLPETAALNPAQTNHVLAILSEALSNAARHAQARRTVVKASQENGQFRMTVEDNGRGFSREPDGSGYGLRNMRDRARLLGGQLTIDSKPGRGTRVTLIAPWEES